MSEVQEKVLFLIPSLQGGGAERVFVSILRHIDRRKFSLALAVVDTRDSIYRADVPEDVDFLDLQCSSVRQAIPKIIRLIWKMKPGVVFSTLGHLNLALAMLRPLLPDNIRYVARESSIVSHLSTAYNVPFWWFWAYRTFYARLDRVICQSRDMREDLIQTFGFPAEKAVVINNPFDGSYVREMAGDTLQTRVSKGEDGRGAIIYLVAAGRLTLEKGFDLLINAIGLCGDSRFRLTLLGEGPLRDELERLISINGLGEQVRLLGFKKNPYPYFAKADVFVLSSRFDGFPNVVLEALACGTPVIATPAPGGVREIIEGVEGCVLTETISAEALAEALANFTPGYRVQPEAIASFGASTIIHQYEQVLLGHKS